ncbi:MAG: integrase arm-type DNA-binding domain-containing protein [Rhodopila sp.]
MNDRFARKLTDASVRNARPKVKPYKMADGGSLYLLVQPNGARLWRYKFRTNGREGVQALGVYPDVSLASAHVANQAVRAAVADGVNPVRKRRVDRQEAERREMLERTGAFPIVVESWHEKTEVDLRANSIRQRTRAINKHLIPEFRHKTLMWTAPRVNCQLKHPSVTQ